MTSTDGAPRTDPAAGHRPVVVLGVAGGSGSGKTSVVDKIVEDVGADRVAVLRHDRYYHDLRHLPLEERFQVNVDHPSAFDDDLFIEHVRALVAGQPVHTPRYDYATFTRIDGADTVEPRPVVLVEGILLFASARIRELVDVKVYVDADADLRLLRRLRRDVIHRGRTVEDVITQYERSVQPMHLEFVEPSKRWADVIVPRGVENVVGVDLVTSRIESLLLQHR
ncbi:MAG TPA: uridine kinase [Acidimicrobiales bacterium]|nr:uridine kinase [Acidimicrobiales bacterium]